MKKIFLVLIILLVSAILISGCKSSDQPNTQEQISQPVDVEKKGDTKGVSAGGDNAQVIIKGFKFVPNELRIKPGTTVTWRNEDSATHTVESVDGSLTSDELQTGDTVSFTFDKPGKVDYICGIHTSMKGSIIIE